MRGTLDNGDPGGNLVPEGLGGELEDLVAELGTPVLLSPSALPGLSPFLPFPSLSHSSFLPPFPPHLLLAFAFLLRDVLSGQSRLVSDSDFSCPSV